MTDIEQARPAAANGANGHGAEDARAHYLGHRLLYSSGVESFNAAGGVLARATAEIQAAKAMAMVFAVFPGMLRLWVARKLGGGVLGFLYLIALAAACGMILLAAMSRRHDFVLSEWRLTIDGKGGAADAVFDHIAHALVQRDAPLRYRRLEMPDAGSANGYLQIRHGNYDAYVSCFPYGNDLYIGWTLWWGATWRDVRQRSAAPWLMWLAAPYFAWMELTTTKSDDPTVDIALVREHDVAKALRECVHAVAREGAEAAAGRVPLQGTGTIGALVPTGIAPNFAGRYR